MQSNVQAHERRLDLVALEWPMHADHRSTVMESLLTSQDLQDHMHKRPCSSKFSDRVTNSATHDLAPQMPMVVCPSNANLLDAVIMLQLQLKSEWRKLVRTVLKGQYAIFKEKLSKKLAVGIDITFMLGSL